MTLPGHAPYSPMDAVIGSQRNVAGLTRVVGVNTSWNRGRREELADAPVD